MYHIDFNKPPDNKYWPVPYEVIEYYVNNGYGNDLSYGRYGKPLDLELAKEIFNILKAESEKP